jgi:signal transduction histidine kinase/ligand-binding sensor domain-containing protein
VREVFAQMIKPVFRILLIAAVLISNSAMAAPVSGWFARNWQSDKGLPNNTVFSIKQTSDGYLWLATSVGLVSFDGHRFQKYAFANPLYQGNRGVFVLVRSRAGGMWVGMDRGGVVYLDGDRTRVFTQKDGLVDAQVKTMHEDGNGTLWIVYLGGTFRQIKEGKVVSPSVQAGELPEEGFNFMTTDRKGQLWWTTGGRLWAQENGKFVSKGKLDGVIHCMCASSKGGIWLAENGHLFHCDATGQLTDCGALAPAQPGESASTMREDTGGIVWLGTSTGAVLRYDGTNFENAAIVHPQIQDLMEDREGNIWVGTQGGGLYQICRRVIELTGIGNGSSVEMVNAVCADGSGGVWALMDNGKVAHRTTESDWQIVTNKIWEGDFIVCANVARDGTLWLGGRSRKVYRWSHGEVSEMPTAPSSIQALLISANGDLWIAGLNFLQRISGDKVSALTIPPEAHSLRTMVEDSNGAIWTGSSRGYLLHVEGDTAKQVPIPNLGTASSIRCLMAGDDGSIWIGHAGSGVARVKDGHYARVGTENGLFDDYVSQIIADDHGWIWFGSDRGIFKVWKAELEAVLDGRADRVSSILFGLDEGVANLQAISGRSPEVARSGDGRLWMPTHSGLAVVDPHRQASARVTPQIILEKVILDGHVLAQYKNILPTWEQRGSETADLQNTQNELRLPPDYRRLEIEFTALSFSGLENLHFRYRLSGLDRDWLEARTDRNASYSRLSYGDYHFEVQVRTAETGWNASGPALTITVLPYFWQRWWFITVMVMLLLVSAGGSVRYFEKRRLQRKLAQIERERAVERERARIAKDIHDDLGASLTRITMLSQSGMNKAESIKPTTTELSRIYDTARSMTNAMDEIVWAINPSNDTLESLAAYFAEFVQEFLAPAGLQFRLDIPLALPRWTISSEIRHNLFLAFKEALNNVVKHSHATEVIVALEIRGNSFILSVQDNGSGFDGDTVLAGDYASRRHGNGLTNMRRRLEELHGQCTIDSRPGSGTRVAFEVKLES